MKNNLLLITIMMFSFAGISQNDKAEEIRIEKHILDYARKVGDPAVAVNSLYTLIALEGDKSTYKDTLAYFYFSSRKYGPTFMMTNEVLQRDPNNLQMMEMKGIALEGLGAYDKASEVYIKLMGISKNNYYGYTLANINFKMKKYDDAYSAIKNTETMNDEGKYRVSFAINQKHTEDVELLAAIPYLKGLIEIELEMNAEAKLSFSRALKVKPDFVLAKENLDAIDKFEKTNE